MLSEHDIPIAPSTYYAYRDRGFGPTEADLADAYAAHELFQLWRKNRRLYGRRKLWKTARRQGLILGRDQIERLMKIAGITGIRRGRRSTVTTRRNDRAPRHPDHVKRRWLWPTRPDQWWVADFSCRRRHEMSYADPRNMPMFSKGVLFFWVDGVMDRHIHNAVSQARMSGLGL